MGSAISMMTSCKDNDILEVIASQLENKRKTKFKKHQLFTQFFRALSFKSKRSMKFASGDRVDGVAMGADKSPGELKRQVGAEHTSIPVPAGNCTSSGTGDVPMEQALFPGDISGEALFTNKAERPDPASASKVPTRLLLQVSTSDLLLCLGEFLRRRCCLLKDLSGEEAVQWLHRVDRFLMQGGWQQQRFIVPGTVVFFYMLCRDIISAEVATKEELQAVLLTCLYVSYSYEGHEISYPAKPFMMEGNRETFWSRTLDIVNRMSGKMLQINNDPQYFGQVLKDLMKMKDH